MKMNQLEKIQLIMLHNKSAAFASLEALPESDLDRLVSQIRLHVVQREAEQARVNLELTRAGLRNLESNFSKIKYKLGAFYSVQQFRTAIADDQFKRSLVWDSEPFAAAKQEEQANVQQEQAERRKFSVTVNALTAQGTNVADNDANYQQWLAQKDEIVVSGSATNLAEAIILGLVNGLVPNPEAVIQDIDQKSRAGLLQSVQSVSRLNLNSPYAGAVKRRILSESTYAELRERADLCGSLADSHSPDPSVNGLYFCSLFASVRDNSQLRDDMEQTKQRKRLRSLSPQELREENQRVRNFDSTLQRLESDQTPDGFKKLRPESRYKGAEITMKTVSRMDKEDVKQLLRLYGRQALDQRLLETRGF
jgi:hypothetical protein